MASAKLPFKRTFLVFGVGVETGSYPYQVIRRNFRGDGPLSATVTVAVA